MALRHGAPAIIFPMALRHGAPAIIFQMALRRGALASTCPGQQLHLGAWSAPALASSSTSTPGQSSRRPASNKPHSAEKSTPVWLAIWRTWAGFANSQLRRATFRSNYSYKCPSALLLPWSRCSDRRKSFGPSAPIAYATSVSPPDEAIAWPGAQVLGAG